MNGYKNEFARQREAMKDQTHCAGCAPVSTPHTPPVAEQASTQAGIDIDSSDFMELLCEFYHQSSCEEFDEPAYNAARAALTAHIETYVRKAIDAKLTEARREPDRMQVMHGLLVWNRAQSNPPIAIAKEYGVASKVLELVAAAPASNTQEGK